MGLLKKLIEKPTVIINGETYVPEEFYKSYLIERLLDVKDDLEEQGEKDGIDYAIICISNS